MWANALPRKQGDRWFRQFTFVRGRAPHISEIDDPNAETNRARRKYIDGTMLNNIYSTLSKKIRSYSTYRAHPFMTNYKLQVIALNSLVEARFYKYLVAEDSDSVGGMECGIFLAMINLAMLYVCH